MLATIYSGAVLGIDAQLVQTQVDVGAGLAKTIIVGLPDKAVQEAAERVASATRNSNFSFPSCRVTVNLAPADIRKEGPVFDLPIALGVLAATEQVTGTDMDDLVAVGELSLDGSVRPVTGVLPIALAARSAGRSGLIVPAENAAEATVVEGLAVYPVRTLWEASEVLAWPERRKPLPCSAENWMLRQPEYHVDFSEVNSAVGLSPRPDPLGEGPDALAPGWAGAVGFKPCQGNLRSSTWWTCTSPGCARGSAAGGSPSLT